MFKTILAASDGSSHAAQAVRIASDLASRYGAKLVLVNVLGHGPVPDALARMVDVEHLAQPVRPKPTNVANVQGSLAVSESGSDSREHRERVRQVVADKILAEAERTAKSAGVEDVVTLSEEGDAADQILDCAKRVSADLIVLGTRGMSDLKGLLMGSVSHKVCQRSECSCVTVK